MNRLVRHYDRDQGKRSAKDIMLRPLTPVVLLIISNVFMTYAWYGHLRDFGRKPLYFVILLSWSVALLEYCFQVPANRIGLKYYSLGQLKIIQEVITMTVFAGFSWLYMKERLSFDYLWAALCMAGAVYFIFRAK